MDLQLHAIDRDGKLRDWLLPLPAALLPMIDATVALYGRCGIVEPWIGYAAASRTRLVGICGFAAPPRDGMVELAYHTFPDFEGQGVATAMAHRLIAISRAADPSIAVIAHTLPEENRSNRILRRLGFRFDRVIQHPEDGLVWRWNIANQSIS